MIQIYDFHVFLYPLAVGHSKLLRDITTDHLSWMVVKKGSTQPYFLG